MKNPKLEGLKEVLRWVILFAGSMVISWFITETLKQITAVPEVFNLKIWVFTYALPVRELFTFGLTFLGRYADKYLHEVSKQNLYKSSDTGLKGILPF